MELNLVPLVGRAVTKVVFTRQLCAQKDFKQPACSWVSCVLILLVVWPEVSQHQSLQAFGWARSWWQPRRARTDELSPALLPPVSVPTVSPNRPCLPQETLQDQQEGLAQALRKALLWPWLLVYTRHCVALQERSCCLPQSCGTSALKHSWLS